MSDSSAGTSKVAHQHEPPPIWVKVPETPGVKVCFVVGVIFVAIGILAGAGSFIPHLTAYALPMQIGALACVVVGILVIIGYRLQKSATINIASLWHPDTFYSTNETNYNHLNYFTGLGEVKWMQLILDNNRDPNLQCDGNTPLHNAMIISISWERKKEVITLLLERGAKINKPNQRGWIPLHSASRGDYPLQTLKFLIENGADINAKTPEGETVLHTYIGEYGFIETPELVAYLIQQKVDMNAQDNNGNTPLHRICKILARCNLNLADRISLFEVLVILVESDADLAIKNKEQKTPWDLIKEHLINESSKVLEGMGCLLDPASTNRNETIKKMKSMIQAEKETDAKEKKETATDKAPSVSSEEGDDKGNRSDSESE
jgi:ankyrin repeat protein